MDIWKTEFLLLSLILFVLLKYDLQVKEQMHARAHTQWG